MPQTINATKARKTFSEIVNQVLYTGQEFIVERQGKPVVLITKLKSKKTKIKQQNTGAFFTKLSRYQLKNAPIDLAQNHDKYTWS